MLGREKECERRTPRVFHPGTSRLAIGAVAPVAWLARVQAETHVASELALVEGISGRVFGSDMVKQGRIIANIIQSYLSALKSYHVDRHLPSPAFSSLRIDRILSDALYLYPHSKKENLPVTKRHSQKNHISSPNLDRGCQH